MPSVPKTGPLSQTELDAIWRSVSDPVYTRGLEEAGDGKGLEVIGQAHAQHARVSLSVDKATQELFLRPWSGQSDEPAAGAAKATVTVAITRTSQFVRAIVIDPGVGLEELTTDMSKTGPVEILPGRRYLLTERVVFVPGEAGPIDATFQAELTGESFNEVPIGEISSWVEPGAGYSNDAATVTAGNDHHRLDSWNQADVVIPEHVGQYVEFVIGANAGQMRRATGYEPPDLAASPPIGGTLLLASTGAYRASAPAGTYQVGETVEGSVSGALGKLLRASGVYLVIDRTSAASLAVGDVVTGAVSGATSTVLSVMESPSMTSESQGATWRVPGWAALGITAANTTQPSGGRSAMLDELGEERGVRRAPDETDEPYRKRLTLAPDVVTPKAVLRAANRVLAPYGLSARLYEASQAGLLGLVLDGGSHFDVGLVLLTGAITGTFLEGEPLIQEQPDGLLAMGRAALSQPVPTLPGDPLPAKVFEGAVATWGTFVVGSGVVGQSSGATCTVVTVVPTYLVSERGHLLLSYADFRAFFLLGVPTTRLGEYGFPYDVGQLGAYDVGPSTSGAYDGMDSITSKLRRAVWQAVNKARAGGVGFDLVIG
jgi:hypothetical protein